MWAWSLTPVVSAGNQAGVEPRCNVIARISQERVCPSRILVKPYGIDRKCWRQVLELRAHQVVDRANLSAVMHSQWLLKPCAANMFLLTWARRWRATRLDARRDSVERHTSREIAFAPGGRQVHTPSTSTAASSDRYIPPPGLTQRYTLQAVCDWYEAFLSSGLSDGPRGLASSLPTQRGRVPGFPGVARQTCTLDEDGIRVQFFDAKGNDAGGLELWSEEHAMLIRTSSGPVFRVRQADTIADLKVGR